MAKFRYLIIPKASLVVQKIEGQVSAGSLARSVRQTWIDPSYDDAMCGILDLREATTDCTPRDVVVLARLMRRTCGPRRWVVLLSEPRLTAMSILFARATAGRLRLLVASTWEAACEFLRVSVPPVVFAKDRAAAKAVDQADSRDQPADRTGHGYDFEMAGRSSRPSL